MKEAVDIPTEDLPRWMRQARRGWDWGLLLVLAISLTAAWPFIYQPGLPRTNASENHVFMTEEFSTALREGRLYPRWSPNTNSGYGAPIPNYYPPLAHYGAAAIKVLFTNDSVTAVRIAYILTYCLAGLSMYLLVNRRAGSASGFMATVLLVFSPYMGLVAPHILGDLPGMAALACLCCFLWIADRLLSQNRPLDLAITAFAGAALILTDPRAAGVGLLLVCQLVLIHRVVTGRKPRLVPLAAALTAAAGLSAFYWLPALAEYDLVRWQPGAWPSEARISLIGLFLPLKPVDVAEMLPAPQFTLGLIMPIAALSTVAAAAVLRKQLTFQIIFLGAGTALTAGALITAPTAAWLMGPIVVCLAAGSSGLIRLSTRLTPSVRRLALVVAFAVALIGSYPVWLPPQWPDSFGGLDPLQQLLFEQEGFGTAVLPANASVPTTLSASATPNRTLVNGYRSGDINKLAPQSGQTGIEVSVLSHGSHGDVFQIGLNAQTRMSVLTAYFPGWQAVLNDRPIGLLRDSATGLMEIDVPPGRGVLRISLEGSRARSYAWATAVLSLVLTAAVTQARSRRRSPAFFEPDMLTLPEVRLLLITWVSFVCGLILFAAAASPFNLYLAPGHGLNNAVALRSRTETGFEAVAYRLERADYHPGETINLSIYWQSILRLPGNYRVQLHLYDPQRDIRWHRSSFLAPGNYPTRRWLTYRYVRDDYQITLSDSILPGEYWITLEVFTCSPGCEDSPRLTFFDSRGASLGQMLTLPTRILITRSH